MWAAFKTHYKQYQSLISWYTFVSRLVFIYVMWLCDSVSVQAKMIRLTDHWLSVRFALFCSPLDDHIYVLLLLFADFELNQCDRIWQCQQKRKIIYTPGISNAIAMQGMAENERQEKWESKQIYGNMPYWHRFYLNLFSIWHIHTHSRLGKCTYTN